MSETKNERQALVETTSKLFRSQGSLVVLRGHIYKREHAKTTDSISLAILKWSFLQPLRLEYTHYLFPVDIPATGVSPASWGILNDEYYNIALEIIDQKGTNMLLAVRHSDIEIL